MNWSLVIKGKNVNNKLLMYFTCQSKKSVNNYLTCNEEEVVRKKVC